MSEIRLAIVGCGGITLQGLLRSSADTKPFSRPLPQSRIVSLALMRPRLPGVAGSTHKARYSGRCSRPLLPSVFPVVDAAACLAAYAVVATAQ